MACTPVLPTQPDQFLALVAGQAVAAALVHLRPRGPVAQTALADPQIAGDGKHNNAAHALLLDLTTISRYADTLHGYATGV